MDFKDKVKHLREKNNMTLEDVAKIVGVSAPTIQRYETGEIANVRRDKIANLAKALNTTPAYLMGWTEEKTEEKPDKKIETIAAHFDGDMTDEELEEIINYIEYVKSKRN